MWRAFLTAFVALAIIQPVFAKSEKEPIRLQPSSPWRVDYADDFCQLTRDFGENDRLVRLVFNKYGPGEGYRLTVVGKPVKTRDSEEDGIIMFGPSEKEQKLLFYKGNSNGVDSLIFAGGGRIAPPTDAELAANRNRKPQNWVPYAPISPEREAAVRYLLIGKPLGTPLLLETGSLRKPFATLAECADAMVGSWGVDAEKHKSLRRPVTHTNNPGNWLGTADYPSEMLEARQPAMVYFRLIVGADGVPTACHIQSTTRPKEFDDVVCKAVMRRARFEPALDAEGLPIVSYYRNSVRFGFSPAGQ